MATVRKVLLWQLPAATGPNVAVGALLTALVGWILAEVWQQGRTFWAAVYVPLVAWMAVRALVLAHRWADRRHARGT